MGRRAPVCLLGSGGRSEAFASGKGAPTIAVRFASSSSHTPPGPMRKRSVECLALGKKPLYVREAVAYLSGNHHYRSGPGDWSQPPIGNPSYRGVSRRRARGAVGGGHRRRDHQIDFRQGVDRRRFGALCRGAWQSGGQVRTGCRRGRPCASGLATFRSTRRAGPCAGSPDPGTIACASPGSSARCRTSWSGPR